MTTPAPDNPGSDLARLGGALAAYRQPLAWALVVIGFVSLLAGGYCFKQAFTDTAPKETSAEADPLTPDGKKAAGVNPNRPEFFLGGVIGVIGALAGLGGGGYLLGRLPRTIGGQSDERVVAATAGGAIGLAVMLLGLGLFALWFGTLAEWLNKGTSPQAWKVITALLVFLVGGGLAFLVVQLLRVDERNNQTLRRIAFGTNTALAVVLLVIGLVAANVVVALKLPAKLDTTASGVHTLHPDTVKLLADLPSNVTVYVTFNEDNLAEEDAGPRKMAGDLKQLLEKARAVNPRRFEVRYLSFTLNKSELSKLRADHPEFNHSDLGMLVVPEGKPGRFVSYMDMQEVNQQARRLSFVGERKLVSVLLSITEDKDQTVYFLAGHGEISARPVGGDEAVGRVRSGSRMATALERVEVTVRPLTFDLSKPEVPDDATVLVIADPVSAIPPEQVAAVRTYLTTPRKNGKKGKLVVLSSPRPNPDGKGLLVTGLETLLAEHGISLGAGYLYFQPATGREMDETDVIPASEIHPLAIQFQDRRMVFPACRSVGLQQRGGGEYLFATFPGRVSWLEPERLTDPTAVWKAMTNAADPKAANELARQKAVTREARGVAVAKSDGGAGQLVVFGSGEAFVDPAQRGGEKYAANADLVAAAVNWLRERPAAANITGKEAGEYKASRDLTMYNGLLLPTVGTLIATLALGVGVWAYRRK